MILSKVQERTLSKMELHKWYSAYGLQCSLSTLNALIRKDKVVSRHNLGHLFSPRTEILFRRKDDG